MITRGEIDRSLEIMRHLAHQTGCSCGECVAKEELRWRCEQDPELAEKLRRIDRLSFHLKIKGAMQMYRRLCAAVKQVMEDGPAAPSAWQFLNDYIWSSPTGHYNKELRDFINKHSKYDVYKRRR